MLEIKKIISEETYPLHLQVLKTCNDYQYKYNADFEKETMHFGAFLSQENVGIVSLMENKHTYFKGKQIQLRGMAVLTKNQGQNVGSRLIESSIIESKKRKTTIIWCNVRDYSVTFYEKQGFKIKGGKFFIENVCNHYVMYLNLDEK